MRLFTDQMGNEISLKNTPQKIVSIVPSQSEFLWDIGVTPAAVTRFCVHPGELLKNVPRVGGTKKLDLKKIRELQPDLIIGNKEENDVKDISQLQKEFNVWMSDIVTIDDALEMMRSVSVIADRETRGETLIDQISSSLDAVKNLFRDKRVAYFIWNDPFMLAGNNTFINSILQHCGFENLASPGNRYPEASKDYLIALDPEFVFLSSEPFPFAEKHKCELQSFLPKANIVFVDGEMFSWYGSRLLKLPAYLKDLEKELL